MGPSFRTKTENSIKRTFYETNDITYITQQDYYIPKNLLKDNLIERISNAFNNLIKLCGGSITKEIF